MFEALKIYKSTEINTDNLSKKLMLMGYKRTKQAEARGDWSLRGGLIDIYPPDFNSPVRIELDFNKVESIYSYNPASGHIIDELGLLILLPVRIKKKRLERELGSVEAIDNFTSISIGDYVVHINHGIGKYQGLKKLKQKNKVKEYLSLEYADGDILYVPKDKMYTINKYVGFREKEPKLYKLGSKKWQTIKKKVTRAIEDLATGLLEMQAMRSLLKGHAFSLDNDWQKSFEDTFSYQQTPDQIKSMKEVKSDMQSSRPMDRLICGDVGYGKTEIAFRAAFKAVIDNKQVAMLVPTTVLVQQHYNNLSKRLRDYPVELRALSRFSTAKEVKETIAGLKEGRVNIVIGTHRLLSKDVKFADLGLVIIDEEQRFGVAHKEKLKKFRLLVDVLTLTATPIPRTLYMSLTGVKDLSTINTPPANRMPVKTYILDYDESLVRHAILDEIERGGQVFFIHNRVAEIETIKNKLEKIVPEALIACAHGQMPEEHLEKTMLEFVNGEFDVLLCTNIVESGLDIPNVNTIIINRADRFGLSDLYQLRGRVGRLNRQAYCYLLLPAYKAVDEKTAKRLEAISKFTELGSGFKIAMEDLEIRGTGNLLGHQQHGYISLVGFDLYCRLLKQSIDELSKGKQIENKKEEILQKYLH
jgi:transcription-repair coupling factor (superfamily II helicase)